MTKIKVAIVGYGLSGKVFHAGLLKEHAQFDIVAVVSSKDLPNMNVCTFDEALKLCDVMVICTPHQLHYEQAKAALNAGVHVVVEKPFTQTLEEANSLFQLAKEKSLTLAVFHNRRYDADFLTLKKMMQEKTLGEVICIESHFDRFRPEPKTGAWREQAGAQSGVWWDLGPHLIDQANQLMGIPSEIHYDIGKQRAGEADDFFDVTFKYSGGRRFHLRSSCIVRDFGFRFRIHGTKGSAVFKTLDVQEQQLRDGMSINDKNFGCYEAKNFQISQDLEAKLEVGSYASFYDELAQVIRSNGQKRFSVTHDDVTFVTQVLLGKISF